MSDTSAVLSPKQAVLLDFEHEMATTRRLLERVPDEHLDWKPHAKSYSLGELATHVSNLLVWMRPILLEEEFDLASVPARGAAAPGRDELLRRFDEGLRAARSAIESFDDAALGRTWTLRHGAHVVLAQPRVVVIRSLGINHLIHHRGQLSVYLRLLDVPLPPMYGPTADESS